MTHFSHHKETRREIFDFKIFQCIDLALSTIGRSEEEELLITLERDYGLSGRDLAKRPEKFEEYLKTILGYSEAAFITIHVRDNISREFGLPIDDSATIAEAVEAARTSCASQTVNLELTPPLNGSKW
jgi:hypothetical protein